MYIYSTMYTKRDWEKACDAAMYNRDTIMRSQNAACYYCLNHFIL